MKARTLFIAALSIALLAVGCKHKPQAENEVTDSTDSIVIEEAQLEFDSIVFHDHPENGPCIALDIHIELPMVSDDIPASKQLRDNVMIFAFGEECAKKASSPEEAMKNFIRIQRESLQGAVDEYKAEAEEYGTDPEAFKEELSSYMFRWETECEVTTMLSTPDLLVVKSFDNNYLGGVHGTYYYSYGNFDVRTGKRLTEKDVFRSDAASIKAINKLIVEAVRDAENNSEEYKGFGVTEWDRVKMNGCFAVTPIGIQYTFNVYEIGCYASGAMMVEIPFAKIAPYLVDGSAVQIYYEKNFAPVQ